jgi:hypothetical protein
MSYCPLISFQKEYCTTTKCMGEDCVLWSYGKDGCLIRTALLKYTKDMVSSKEVSREDELEAQKLQAISIGFPVMNFGNTIEKDWSGLQGGL